MQYILFPDDARPTHQTPSSQLITLYTFPDTATVLSPFPIRTAPDLPSIESTEGLTPLDN